MRWLLMAWRAQRGGLLEAWEQQRELMVLYARFYVALMLGILFSWRLAECAPHHSRLPLHDPCIYTVLLPGFDARCYSTAGRAH